MKTMTPSKDQIMKTLQDYIPTLRNMISKAKITLARLVVLFAIIYSTYFLTQIAIQWLTHNNLYPFSTTTLSALIIFGLVFSIIKRALNSTHQVVTQTPVQLTAPSPMAVAVLSKHNKSATTPNTHLKEETLAQVQAIATDNNVTLETTDINWITFFAQYHNITGQDLINLVTTYQPKHHHTNNNLTNHPERLAIHEAGHATALLHFNHPITTINISSKKGNGYTAYNHTIRTKDDAWEQLIILISGSVAENMWGDHYLNGSDSDFERAQPIATILHTIHNMGTSVEDVYQLAIKESRNILTQHATTHALLTQELINQGTLTEEHIITLLTKTN